MADVATVNPSHDLHRFDLHRFELSDMIEMGRALRQTAAGSGSMEETAAGIVQYLYNHFTDPGTKEKNCVLVRFFKTHRFSNLPTELQDFARDIAHGSEDLNHDTRCLTLLATSGSRREWNTRGASAGHKAIPLTTEEVVRKAPMVAQLIQQIGLDIGQVIGDGRSLMIDAEQRNYNVFHVPEAQGSPFVPAQDFVRQYGVKSVIGFGGMLPSAELFAVILFSRVFIPRESAEMFRTLALGIKLAILPFAGGQVFSKAV
jgi:two-component system NtrC family sensor kinase